MTSLASEMEKIITQKPIVQKPRLGPPGKRRNGIPDPEETPAEKRLRRLLSLPKERALPEPVDIFDLFGADLERPPELVEGILHKGSKMVIGGGSKSFKTWSLLDLAISVSAGVPWWNFPTKKGRTMYINFEIQDAFFIERVNDLLDAKGCNLDRGQFCYWGLRGHGADLRRLSSNLLAATQEEDFSLIVIDPIYKSLGNRDENKAGDIASLLNELEQLAVDTGAAVAFGHHFSKGNQAGKSAMDRIGGSGVFARDPDTILTMTSHEEEEAFTVDAILRNFAPIDPFVIRRRHPLMVRDEELDPRNLKQLGAPKEKYSDEDILASLDEEPMSTTDWAVHVSDRIGISVSGFMVRLRQLKSKGLIAKEGKEWVRLIKVRP